MFLLGLVKLGPPHRLRAAGARGAASRPRCGGAWTISRPAVFAAIAAVEFVSVTTGGDPTRRWASLAAIGVVAVVAYVTRNLTAVVGVALAAIVVLDLVIGSLRGSRGTRSPRSGQAMASDGNLLLSAPATPTIGSARRPGAGPPLRKARRRSWRSCCAEVGSPRACAILAPEFQDRGLPGGALPQLGGRLGDLQMPLRLARGRRRRRRRWRPGRRA